LSNLKIFEQGQNLIYLNADGGDGSKLGPQLQQNGKKAERVTWARSSVLVGGLRVLGATLGKCTHGVFTKRPETLTNDFFVNLPDMGTQWQPSAGSEGVYEGRDWKTNEIKWTGTRGT
jgi:catalase (peroxidase I)